MATPETVSRLLGELAVERGLVTVHELHEALAAQHETGRLLGEILVEQFDVAPDAIDALLDGNAPGAPPLRPPSLVPRPRRDGRGEQALIEPLEDLRERVAVLSGHVARMAVAVEGLAAGESQASGPEALAAAVEKQSQRIEALERAVLALVEQRDSQGGLTALTRLLIGSDRRA